MNTDNPKVSGGELEIEILTRLCGWTDIDRAGCYGLPSPNSVLFPLPPISTDETASMFVVRAMRARGYGLDLTTMGETAWNALWYMPKDAVVGGFAADADTLPMAICLAAKAWIDAQSEVKP